MTVTLQNYIEREEYILRVAAGKRVLHLGCIGLSGEVDDDRRMELSQDSLHAKLSRIANTTGVDLSDGMIEKLRRTGTFHNILHGNVEELGGLGLERVFDVVVAGDIIEHISNPGRMLDGILPLCHPRTVVLITTPNAFGLPRFLQFSFGGFTEFTEHVTMFNPTNLQNILERHGFVVNKRFTCHQPKVAWSPLIFKIGKKFFERFPKFGGTLLFSARPKTE